MRYDIIWSMDSFLNQAKPAKVELSRRDFVLLAISHVLLTSCLPMPQDEELDLDIDDGKPALIREGFGSGFFGHGAYGR